MNPFLHFKNLLLNKASNRGERRRRTTGPKTHSFRPCIEALECRLLPATTPVPVALTDLTLSVKNALPIARIAEPVTSGVPLPQSLNLTSTQQLRLLDSSGQDVPAEFSVLGRWNAAPQDASMPIRWLEVSFAANVAANDTAVYTLDIGPGTPPAGIQVTQSTGLIDILTGPARFQIDRSSFDLFHSVWLDTNNDGAFSDDEAIVTPNPAGGSYVLQGPTEYRSSQEAPLSVTVEESGPLKVVVRAEGFHAAGPGQELLRYVTRMTFFAGQSYVDVNQTIVEGRVKSDNADLFDANGQFGDGQQITNFDQAGLRVELQLNGAATVQLRGSQDAVPQGVLTAGGVAEIEQHRLSNLALPMSYDAHINGTQVESGKLATRAWLDLSDSRWGLAVTTKDFYQKDPEALRAAADGTVQVEFPSEPYTIFQGMGLGEDAVYYFHTAGTSTEQLQRVLEGFGKDRLLAVAPARWMLDSGAFGTLPRASLPAEYANFNTFVTDSYNATLAWVKAGHTYGLLNYLDLPAYDIAGLTNLDRNDWGDSYYDPSAAVLNQFARTGNVDMLKQFVIPYVQHYFTTDAYNTDDLTSFQNGISGNRGAYHRGIWTGQYNYLESLWTYYYLTGDRAAIERGTAAAHSYATADLWANDANYGIGALGLTTRNASQKYNTMIEAWLATGDSSLKSALDTQMHDYLTHMYTSEGFVVFPYTHGSSYYADQAFMVTNLIDDTVYKYYQLTGDPLARDFVVTTPQRIAQYNRVSQNPSSPDYYNFYTNIQVTVTGPGKFTTKPAPPQGNSDDYLYLEGKLSLGTALARAALITGDQTLMAKAEELYKYGIPQLDGGLWQKDIAEKSLRAFTGLGILVGSSSGAASNQAPALDAISDKTVLEGNPVNFTARAQDPDGDALTFSLDAGAPAGAAIDPVSGFFSWTPTAAQGVGTYSITVRVTDSGTPALSATALFHVFVTDGTTPAELVLAATADNYLDGRYGADVTANNGSEDVLRFYEDWSGGQFRPVVRFDLSGVPAGALLAGAHLELYHLGSEFGNAALPVTIRGLSHDWTEDGSSWANAQAGTPWQTSGGDVLSGGVDATLPASPDQAWASFDVTGLVRDWLSGQEPNFGFLFQLAPGATDSVQTFASREYSDPTLQPRLVLDFGDSTPASGPAGLSFSSQPLSSVRAGNEFGAAVHVVDRNGHSVAGTSVMLGITSGTLNGTLTATTDGSGNAVFSDLSVNVTGSYQLEATVAGLVPVLSGTFRVSPEEAAGLSFATPPPASFSAGSTFRPVVQLVDSFGNPVARAGVVVQLSLTSAALKGHKTATTNSAGQAVFSSLSATAAGTHVLTASATALSSASSAVSITPAAPAKIAFVTQPPASLSAGSLFTPVVSVTDRYGNAVAGTAVSLGITSATLTGTTTVSTDASGQAVFSDLAETVAGTYRLRASVVGLSTVRSRVFTIIAAAPSTVSFVTAPPANVMAGQVFRTMVLVTDLYGNVVRGTAVSLSFTSGILNGTTTVRTNKAGRAIFSNLRSTTAGIWTLLAVAGSSSGSSTVTITPAV